MRHNRIHKLIYIQKSELESTLKRVSVKYLDIQMKRNFSFGHKNKYYYN